MKLFVRRPQFDDDLRASVSHIESRLFSILTVQRIIEVVISAGKSKCFCEIEGKAIRRFLPEI